MNPGEPRYGQDPLFSILAVLIGPALLALLTTAVLNGQTAGFHQQVLGICGVIGPSGFDAAVLMRDFP